MNDDLRQYINILMESNSQDNVIDITPQPVEEPKVTVDYKAFYKLIFKLRSYREPEVGDYGFGVEAGMDKAASMLESMLNRMENGS